MQELWKFSDTIICNFYWSIIPDSFVLRIFMSCDFKPTLIILCDYNPFTRWLPIWKCIL